MMPAFSDYHPRNGELQKWVSVTRYATIYGVSRTTVYKWLDAGLLESYRVSATLRIRNMPPISSATVHSSK